MYWREEYGYDFPRAAPRPKAAAGKARKKFGLTWWGKKWVEAVENKGDENRMSRGRAYARAEKAHGIDVKPGRISAKVKGSYGTYSVSIQIEKFSPEEWDSVIHAIRSSPALGILLNNEMPQNIDELAEEAIGDSLIPDGFRSRCSCPDYANPCKHIAAVYYTLADEIDRAPQILFAIRGMGPQELLASLSGEAKTLQTGKKSPKTAKKKTAKTPDTASRNARNTGKKKGHRPITTEIDLRPKNKSKERSRLR